MLRKALISALSLMCVALAGLGPAQPSYALSPSLLPGEQRWANGVSSYLFGINDTYDWATQNLDNTPAAQQALKNNGFTLVRSFFSQTQIGWPYPQGGPTTDQALEDRFSTIEHVGAQCLGVLAGGNSLAFDDHLLTYAETSVSGRDRCNIWEFHNEPAVDATYIADWNSKIAYLRAHHPDDKFIGPVYSCACMQPIQNFLNSVKASGVLPDAISYHDYPCWASTDYVGSQAGVCDAQIQGHYSADILQVKAMVRNTLGIDLPVGITEWNVSPNFVNCVGGQSPLTVDPNYQPHFIQEMYRAMEAGGLDFATQFDAMSGAGVGTCGSLDLLKSDGSGQAWLPTYGAIAAAARAGAPLPSSPPAGQPTAGSTVATSHAQAAASLPARARASLQAAASAPASSTANAAPTGSAPASTAGRRAAPLPLPALAAAAWVQPLLAGSATAGLLLAIGALTLRRRLLKTTPKRSSTARATR